MQETINQIKCDACGKELKYKKILGKKVWYGLDGKEIKDKWISETFTVKFMTEQTEGTSTKPYLESCTLDLCPECYKKYIDNFPLKAYGAGGYNTYAWNDETIITLR